MSLKKIVVSALRKIREDDLEVESKVIENFTDDENKNYRLFTNSVNKEKIEQLLSEYGRKFVGMPYKRTKNFFGFLKEEGIKYSIQTINYAVKEGKKIDKFIFYDILI